MAYSLRKRTASKTDDEDRVMSDSDNAEGESEDQSFVQAVMSTSLVAPVVEDSATPQKSDEHKEILAMFQSMRLEMIQQNTQLSHDLNATLGAQMTHQSEGIRTDLGASINSIRTDLTSTRTDLGAQMTQQSEKITKVSEDLEERLGDRITKVSEDLGGRITKVSEDLRAQISEQAESIGNLSSGLSALRTDHKLMSRDIDKRFDVQSHEIHESINVGIHEVPGVRLPLQTSYASASPHAVFMYSTGGEGSVTLQLRDPDDLDDKGGLASVLARLQQEDATLSISYQDTEFLTEGSIDVLLGAGSFHATGNGSATATFDLFDSESGQDLTLSPQTFTSSTEAFINDNSDSIGVPGDTDTVGSTEDAKVAADSSKLAVKKPRPKASSPNRQGPQQCQVCGKVFGNASALAKHKLTHSDERKYVCNMCGKAFKRQDHLNGHMLTHRNKKPYECKAEGCGKSYCDARSLRRHTENHHSGSHSSSSSSSSSSSTSSNSTNATSSASTPNSGDETSPLASTCIQYAPPTPQPASTSSTASTTTTTSSTSANGKQSSSHLQKLLNNESSTASSTTSTKSKNSQSEKNDCLTKVQLELINQIMEQTKLQADAIQKQQQQQNNNSSKSGCSNGSKSNSNSKCKTWSNQNSSGNNGSNSKSNGSTSQTSSNGTTSTTTTAPSKQQQQQQQQGDPKPVECNLCHRKFKNIPALNGHMRLHGGYFKKDSENKKCEKKEVSGPPLQTASMSVRALIEEKIIQKRITNPQLSAAHVQTSSLTYTTASDTNGGSTHFQQISPKDITDQNVKMSSFAVPAPPVQNVNEKIRRHSDSEHFAQPRNTIEDNAALTELLLKRSAKNSMKRASSDPGHHDSNSPSPHQQIQLSFQTDTYLSEVGITYQTEDGGYFSPSLQEDVFQQSVQDTMLLHGMDPAQLAETIQFHAATLLQEHATVEQLQEIASLDGYQNTQSPQDRQHEVSQDLQTVLDSPLPAGLADFSTYGRQSKDMAMEYHSPLQQHTVLAASSPLPSPLTRHDSPGFAYPTPPASQEGQSPSFGHSVLPLSSPQDTFGASVISHVPPASSPLSAALYTTTMSSSAAVEAALSEVLPGESQGCLRSHNLSLYNSPPPQSPLSATPVPSPLSLSSAPASSSSVTSQGQTFSMSPHHTLQSHMMPNSDDPLLSSSPKEFGNRKKFDFGNIHALKLVGNGLVEYNSQTGLLVDTIGELQYFQVLHEQHQLQQQQQAQQKALMAGTNFVHSSNIVSYRKCDSENYQNNNRNLRPNIQIGLDTIKEEVSDNNVFLNPTNIADSSLRTVRRKYLTETPYFLPHPNPSRLRASRVRRANDSLPYTPPPILNPTRSGQGLYWQISTQGISIPARPSSTTASTNKNGTVESPSCDDYQNSREGGFESDCVPHINVGSEYQCSIPEWNSDKEKASREPSHEHLLWDPGITKVCSETEINMYLQFACCAAVPAGGHNKEYALHLLCMCHGNIREAMLKLMQPTPPLMPGHPLLSYDCNDSNRWSADEMDIFHRGLLKYDKDFRSIAREIGSKTIKQCIQFYYFWKKVCPEEYKRLRLLRRHQIYDPSLEMEFDDLRMEDSRQSIPVRHRINYAKANDVELVSTSSESRLFVCEYPDCSSSFNSRAALNGHIRIHGGGVCGRSPTPDKRPSAATPPVLGDILEEFPCKICGKVFNKVKSRSAHMKSHRPPDAEPKKPKLDSQKSSSSASSASSLSSLSSSSSSSSDSTDQNAAKSGSVTSTNAKSA